MPLDSSTAITLFGVTVWDEGVKEKWRKGSSSATRILRCAWNDRLVLIAGLLGGTTLVGGVEFPTDPAEYPDGPFLLADGIDVDGEGTTVVGGNGMIGYTYAVLTLTYGPGEPEEIDNEEVGFEQLDFSSDSVSFPLDVASWKYPSGEEVDPLAIPSLPVSTVDFTRGRKRYGRLPTELVIELIDHVNDTTFYGAPAETILFQGGVSARRLLTTGASNWDVVWKFKYKRTGWNKQWNPATATFEKVTAIGGGPTDTLFPTGDLSQLVS